MLKIDFFVIVNNQKKSVKMPNEEIQLTVIQNDLYVFDTLEEKECEENGQIIVNNGTYNLVYTRKSRCNKYHTVISINPTQGIISHYVNGYLHDTDGPAKIVINDTLSKYYYYRGEELPIGKWRVKKYSLPILLFAISLYLLAIIFK